MDKRFTDIRPPIDGSSIHPSLLDIIQTYFSMYRKDMPQEYISKWCEEEAKIELPLGEIIYGELETTDTTDYAKIVESVLSFVFEFSKAHNFTDFPYLCDWSGQLLKTMLDAIQKHQK